MARWSRRPDTPRVVQIVAGSTIAGDNTMVGQLNVTTLEVSRREFRLEPFAAHDGALPAAEHARAQPSRLLEARLGVVPFAWRGSDLAWLEAWREGRGGGLGRAAAAARSVFLVHGEGGSGKTRLARRFAQDSARGGWSVWQASYDPAASLSAPAGESVAGDLVAAAQHGALLLVDYAERWPTAQLLALLRQARTASEGKPVRALLLSRSAGAWWDALSHRLGREDTPCETHPLQPLSTGPRSAALLFAAARDRFAEVLQVPDSAAITVPDLSHGDYALVLAVHMAALVAVDARLHDAQVPSDPARLSGYLLSREREAWRSLPPEQNQRPRSGSRALGRTVYAAVLAGPLPYRDGARVLNRLQIADTADATSALLDDHGVLYPARQQGTVLEPLYPDRLAEDFIALSTPHAGQPGAAGTDLSDPWAADAPALLFAPDSSGDADDATDTAGLDAPSPSWSRSGLAVLIETSRRWPHMAEGQLYPLLRSRPELAAALGGAALAGLADDLAQQAPDILGAIEPHLPDGSDFELDLGIAALAQRLAERRMPELSDPAARARLLHRLGWRYANAGLHEQARARLAEAVELCRGLPAADPDSPPGPDLARVLEHLGHELSELDRPHEALAAIEEAARLRQEADPDSPAYARDLAYVRLALGDRLVGVGKYHEGLELREDAVRRYRELAEAEPGTPSPGLAAALDSLSRSRYGEDRMAEAVALAQECVELNRRLAAADPKAHTRHLASALAYLGHLCTVTGQESGPAAIEESISLSRVLAAANPQAHLEALAQALHEQSGALAEAGRFEAALAPQQESTAIWRQLAQAEPQTYPRLLASSLDALANRLADADCFAEALAAAQESVDLLRPLAEAGPGVYEGWFATSSATLGRRFEDLGRAAQAVETTQTAVKIWRRLVDAHGEMVLRELAGGLRSLSRQQQRLGWRAEAVASVEEALPILRRLAEGGTGRDRGDLAAALGLLGGLLAADPDRADDVLKPAEEAVAIQRRLYESHPGSYHLALTSGVYQLAQQLSAAGRHGEALPLADEALALARALAMDPGLGAAPDLRRLRLLELATMGCVLVRLEAGRELPEALTRLSEAEYLVQRLTAEKVPGYRPADLDTVDGFRIHILDTLGRTDEAAQARRALFARKSADQHFLDTLDPSVHPVRRFFRLLDMTETSRPRGGEALAVHAVAAEPGSVARANARRLLIRRSRAERRAERKSSDRLPAALQADSYPVSYAAPPAPSAASLLADITAAEAVDPRRGVRARRSSARQLARSGDQRGTDILVAQALDSSLTHDNREAAAEELTRIGDPRGRHLLADALAAQAADVRTSGSRRHAAVQRLTELDDPRGADLRAASDAVESTAASDESRRSAARPLTVRAGLPAAILRNVSAEAAAALDGLSAARLRPERSRGARRRDRCIAALIFPLPAAIALLIGNAAGDPAAGRLGPGNWLALCISALILLLLAPEVAGSAARFTARAYDVGPDAKDALIGGYVVLTLLFVLAGFFLAPTAASFPQSWGTQVWELLIWR